VILDLDGMVAELETAKIFLAKDGATITLVTNSTFLAGLALRRAMQLWHDAGKEVRQVVVTGEGLLDANEIGRLAITPRLSPSPGSRIRNYSPVRSTKNRGGFTWTRGMADSRRVYASTLG
jgi:branched-subunit amino acid aminotransferase/4-amino-4-deoxychorismate lyase